MSVKLTTATDTTLYFEVTSTSRPDETHNVYFDVHDGWMCSCEHHFFRKVECKHIQACKDWLTENRNHTIIGVGCHKITIYNENMLIYATNMSTFNEIIKGGTRLCNYPIKMKSKI
ncbi:MAG: hypothetical protein IJH63_00755 [Methanobrevibacter sp.]|nr:hypothetical protein [Methanosphaera sp.]MBR0369234.1 hypothetical protein [Methanobrevibacter sp.]